MMIVDRRTKPGYMRLVGLALLVFSYASLRKVLVCDPAIVFTSPTGNTNTSTSPTSTDVNRLHSYIIGPDDADAGRPGACDGPQPMCGCPASHKDCPQWYSLAAIQASAALQDPVALDKFAADLDRARVAAKAACDAAVNPGVQRTGGWCKTRSNDVSRLITFGDTISYPMANNHVWESRRIASELVELIRTEKITSINDFGAGVAQYKAAILPQVGASNITYLAYDGAGNGPEYTHGMMGYLDMTLPLDLPVTDWVLCLEVGEHVPSKYEGMVIRNLHRHNRRGVILSWGVLGQSGHSHINNHSNEYVIRVFEGLGYDYDRALSNKMRNSQDNYKWFEHSVMVFRRK